MFQLYLHDITASLPMDLNEHGLFEYNEIDFYFNGDENHHAFFVKVDGKYAGFVLIDDNFMVLNKEKGNYDFSKMFILNAYKNKGIRWTSVSMIISASIFVIVLEAGKLLFNPLLLQSFNEGSLNIPESMFFGLLNFTFFKFYLVPLIFIGLAIVLLIIFRKKEQEPVIMQDGNIVTQAQL